LPHITGFSKDLRRCDLVRHISFTPCAVVGHDNYSRNVAQPIVTKCNHTNEIETVVRFGTTLAHYTVVFVVCLLQ
jgi:hypothetical protein